MHKDYYCAYHHTQIITSFCRCPQCLLPTCSACVKLHSQQHSINNTEPHYETITDIFKEIAQQVIEAEKKAKSLGRSLLIIQKGRKEEMNDLRHAITRKGKEIVEQFQLALRKLDQQMMEVINSLDDGFIREIVTIDDEVLKLESDVSREKSGLESEESLKTIISYFELNQKQNFEQRIITLTDKIRKLGQKKIYVKFISDFQIQLETILKQFIQITQRTIQN